jgi:hypothetical protein
MIRKQRRRLERQWNKIKIGETCTEFIERNNLFSLPHVIAFQAIKISEELVCVYNVGLFESKRDKGHGEFVTICWFVNGSLRSVGSVQIAFIPEGNFYENEEIDE